MDRAQTQILVVDDDATQGGAIRDLFLRAGYQCTLCTASVQAATLAQRQEFHAVVIDCMLPRMNGVDLVEEIKQVAVKAPFVILYSGIFKDKNFAKDALERTGAAAFLTKPLDLKEVLGLVNDHFAGQGAAPTPEVTLTALYGAGTLDEVALTRLISAEPTLSGVHLPMLYRRLEAARVTGELSMVTATGDLNSVSLYRGRIFSVRTPDKDSIFGGLAVSLGFVVADDLKAATRDPSRKMMGQKLVESLSLSPHAIQLVLEEQLALRLSQTIEDGPLTLDWSARKFSPPEFSLSLERHQQLTEDWTSSKLTPEVVRVEFLNWADFAIAGHGHGLPEAQTLGDLLNDEVLIDRDVPKFLRELLAGNLTIGPKLAANADFRFLENRLSHLLEAYETQNYFQVLGIGEKAQALEINRAYEGLSNHFNPAGLPANCPPRLMVKATQVFKVIEAAYHTLSDEVARHRYVLVQHNKRAQARLENEPLMRAASLQLQNGQHAEAAQVFQDLIDKRLDFPDLRAHRLWAGLLCDRRYNDLTLENIPPEERHSAAYHMARGTHFRVRGDLGKAYECYQAALAMDPRLAAARAEMERTRAELELRTGRSLFSDVQTLFSKVRRSG